MAGDTEQLVVSLEARIKDFERNFLRANRTANQNFKAIEDRAKQSGDRLEKSLASSVSRIGDTFANLGKGFGAGIIGALSVAGLEQIVQRVADVAKGVASIGDEAKRAGLSTKAFQELGFVASQNRIGVDALTDGMKELSLRADEWITTGGGPAAEAFQRLGFSASELKTKLADPSALLSEIIDRVQKLDRAAQIRVFDEVFGGTGGEKFVQLIDRGAESIRKAVQEAHDLGIVLDDEVIKKADEIDRKFNAIATTISTNLKRAVVSVVSSMADIGKNLNGTKEQAVALAGNRLMETYKAIEETKAKLDDLYLDKAAFPNDVAVDLNIQRATEDLELLKKRAMEIRDVMDRYQGYPGDEAEQTKPKVDQMNSAITNTGTTATTAVTGIKSYTDAIRALRQEVPALAEDLAKVDAQTRIDNTYRAALSKARTMGEVYQANQLRGEALQALDIKSAGSDPTKFLSSYLDKSKTSQSLTGMQSQFSGNLAKMFAAAPADVRGATTIYSGYRSIERQQELWTEALKKYGSVEEARKWVAPPGNSQHNMGNAADLRFGNDAAKQWFHDNADKFGLSFPLANESWHIEDAAARGQMKTEEFQRRAEGIQQQAEAYDQIINQSKQFISSQNTEQQALTMTEQRAAAYRHEQELLRQAQAAGIQLTDQQRAKINQLATGMAQAEQRVKSLSQSQEQAAETAKFFGNAAVDGLTGLITGTMTAEQAMQQLASAMIRAALQGAILGEGPFASGTGKGLLSLFGFASGGYTGDGGKHEPAGIVHKGEYVFSKQAVSKIGVGRLNAAHHSALKGFAAGGYVGKGPSTSIGERRGGGGNVTFSPATSINVEVKGNMSREDGDALAGNISRQVNQALEAKMSDFTAKQLRNGGMIRNRGRWT